ncbi:flagellar brake protein [Evansella halocellulosilytica]|uniref:flagellar brake protein n=1 Tax=Evansella halocellulosilytica TaxID=2011013 RepID=UPI000BB8552A|nr:flagellar brake domain-containing protein [Evansella halocellulosilytica]
MIKIGSVIYIETNSSEEDKKRYRSKILDYERDQIFIDFPVDEQSNKPIYFLQGTQLRAWFLGEDEAFYLFHTEVLGKSERNIPMIILHDPGTDKYARIQRRQYVRVDTSVDVAVQLPHSKKLFTSISLDISGGGMAVELPVGHDLKAGEEVTAWIALAYQSGEINHIKTRSYIVRILQDNSREKASFQFVGLNEQKRQMIVRYCFEKQLERRRKQKDF